MICPPAVLYLVLNSILEYGVVPCLRTVLARQARTAEGVSDVGGAAVLKSLRIAEIEINVSIITAYPLSIRAGRRDRFLQQAVHASVCLEKWIVLRGKVTVVACYRAEVQRLLLKLSVRAAVSEQICHIAADSGSNNPPLRRVADCRILIFNGFYGLTGLLKEISPISILHKCTDHLTDPPVRLKLPDHIDGSVIKIFPGAVPVLRHEIDTGILLPRVIVIRQNNIYLLPFAIFQFSRIFL